MCSDNEGEEKTGNVGVKLMKIFSLLRLSRLQLINFISVISSSLASSSESLTSSHSHLFDVKISAMSASEFFFKFKPHFIFSLFILKEWRVNHFQYDFLNYIPLKTFPSHHKRLTNNEKSFSDVCAFLLKTLILNDSTLFLAIAISSLSYFH